MQATPPDYITESTRLAALWQGLVEGQLFMSACYCGAGRCYALLERRSKPAPLLDASAVRLLERIFEGESQKALAYELNVSIATVAAHSARVLRTVARHHLVSRAPLILVMAALAARGLPLRRATLEEVRDDGSWLISVATPDATFDGRLSSSEALVVSLAMEGATYAEIATGRGTSVRTVANQLASAFHKLGVSGRSMLRAKGVHHMTATHVSAVVPPATERPESTPVRARLQREWQSERLLAYG